MNRRELFKMAGVGLSTTLPTLRSRSMRSVPSQRPNLLFLISDQQRADTLHVYGNNRNIAPNLNRLAGRSAVFKQYYITQPLCTPSRGSLLSGLYPHTDGATTNNLSIRADVPVLVQMLEHGDYTTAYYGKWHLGNEICKQHGFDYFESTEDGYSFDSSACGGRTHSGYYNFLVKHGIKPRNGGFSRSFANELPKELSKPAYLAGMAENFLEKHRDKPWAMYVSFLDPHPPYNSVNDKMYDPASIPVPKTFSEKPNPTELERYKAIRKVLLRGHHNSREALSSPLGLQKVKSQYWGKITLVDEMIGRILKRLEDLNLADNTIIVFTSDHGDMMGDHRLMFKSVMFEQAVKVPMLLHVPWMPNQSPRIQQLASGIDLVPTLLELMSQPLPRHLQGRSWAPYLLSSAQFPERDVIIEYNGPPVPFFSTKFTEPLRTIRTSDSWKMTLTEGGAGELYNLRTDPQEMTNLFYRKESLSRIRELVLRINLWQRSTGDKMLRFDSAEWRGKREDYIRQGLLNRSG